MADVGKDIKKGCSEEERSGSGFKATISEIIEFQIG